jgi:hypothetical protein
MEEADTELGAITELMPRRLSSLKLGRLASRHFLSKEYAGQECRRLLNSGNSPTAVF